MTVAEARALAQQDPVPQLTKTWGEAATETRHAVANLEAALRLLDKIEESLKERGLTVSTDLGPVGNSARAARATIDAPHTFDRGRTA